MRDDPAMNGRDRSPDRSNDRSSDRSGSDAPTLDVSEIASAIRDQGRQILDATRTLASVQLDRARISLLDSMWAIGLALVGGAVLITFTCAAALRLLDGTSDAIAAGTGQAWAGPLLSGAIGLTAVGLLVRRAGQVRVRRRAARLLQKYDVRPPAKGHAVARGDEPRAGVDRASRPSSDASQSDIGEARPGGNDVS